MYFLKSLRVTDGTLRTYDRIGPYLQVRKVYSTDWNEPNDQFTQLGANRYKHLKIFTYSLPPHNRLCEWKRNTNSQESLERYLLFFNSLLYTVSFLIYTYSIWNVFVCLSVRPFLKIHTVGNDVCRVFLRDTFLASTLRYLWVLWFWR